MSRTLKPGKRGHRRIRKAPESTAIADSVASRHSFGSTEKIRRRNRKTWTRLANKQRRALDRAAEVAT